MIINNNTPNELAQGLLTVWTNNPRIITSSIYNNSVAFSEFLNTKVIKKVTNIFLTSIEKIISSIESINSFFSSGVLEIKKSLSKHFFETPKADVRAIYKKAQGQTEEELRILPNFKKINILSEAESQVALENIIEPDLSEYNILRRTQSLPTLWMPFYAIDDVDQIFAMGAENDKLPLPLSPTVLENPINSARIKKFSAEQNSAKELQERESFLRELEEFTLNEPPESTIIQEILQKNQQKNEVINARLKKFHINLVPLTPLSNHHEDALTQDLDDCKVNWLEKTFTRVST